MPHTHPVRVYWEDTDAGGIVYYANYLKFAERGRSEALRSVGFGQRQLQEEFGIAFVVKRCEIDYHRSAVLDDTLLVESHLQAMGKARMTMSQRIMRDDTELATLTVTLACVGAGGKPTRIADTVKQKLQPLFGE